VKHPKTREPLVISEVSLLLGRLAIAATIAGLPLVAACDHGARPARPTPMETVAPSAPRITALTWDTLGIPTANFCPLAHEFAVVTCSVVDDEKDGYTITLTLESLGPGTLSPAYPATVTAVIPAGAPDTENQLKAFFALEGTTAHVQAVCQVVDSHGLRDLRTGGCL
jgi:hypothetical protein